MKRTLLMFTLFLFSAAYVLAAMPTAQAQTSAYNAGKEAGKTECINDPVSCGADVYVAARIIECLNDPTVCGFQSQLDLAKAIGKEEGKTECINDPAACGLQSQLDLAESIGKVKGKTECLSDPAACGFQPELCLSDLAACGLQPTLDAAISTAKAECLSDPVSCGLQPQLDGAKSTGKAECLSDPIACGLQPQLDVAKSAGKAECLSDPASCGIDTKFTQSQLDAAISVAKAECLSNPASCGIDAGFTQSQLDAAISAAKAECVSNPASCGIDAGFIQSQLDAAISAAIAECQSDPAACGVHVTHATACTIDPLTNVSNCIITGTSKSSTESYFTQSQLLAYAQANIDECVANPAACGIGAGCNSMHSTLSSASIGSTLHIPMVDVTLLGSSVSFTVDMVLISDTPPYQFSLTGARQIEYTERQ
ncbi:MAG: hypothetical protein GY862_31040 [Gammaproteobacteria bacterium]|nr:hypothetical protein [Gammaproteobacteria bacterium]